jgi:dihydroorotase
MKDFDLILKGGHVVDPGQKINSIMDLAFQGGKVAALENKIPVSRNVQVKDMSGLVITPGLIDLHTHVYWGGTSIGIEPDAYSSASAVSTLVDTGSVGPGNFHGFKSHIIDKSRARILVFLHISHAGIFAFSDRVMVGESEEMRLMDPITAIEVAKANKDIIVGIKVRLGRWTSGNNGLAPLEIALEVSEASGLPLMVHIDEPPPSYKEIVKKLRKGDILTHSFRGFPNSPLTMSGDIEPEVLLARSRGVYFDIGHGSMSFSFDTAEKMLKNNFFPDSISSDVHCLCINGPAFDQVTTLSKFYSLGMPLIEVVRASTQNVAKILTKPDLGSLKVGTVGDASILKIQDGSYEYEDGEKNKLIGKKKISAYGLVINGKWVKTN